MGPALMADLSKGGIRGSMAFRRNDESRTNSDNLARVGDSIDAWASVTA